ncbi:MAG: exodeoxyribonuclease VII large subunit, partial [Planctomycetes bacterium]|nr:exodeoxyribonuclease VII large subunit [Planctomycetota bacterium]
MSGHVELAADGANLNIRFPYRPDLVDVVKSLPSRRWDPKDKVWRVPATDVEKVYAVFSRHLFEFAPEVSALLAGTLRPAAAAPARRKPKLANLPLGDVDGDATSVPPAAGAAPTTAPALTVSQLNEVVRDGLKKLFPAAFWVVGEVVDFDKGAGKPYRFFKLVEKSASGDAAEASVEIAMFSDTVQRLLPALARHEPPLTLRDGLEIRALVRVDLYAKTGRFQLQVQDIDPSFTLGKLALTREQVLRELAQAGLAQRNRSLGFPVPALRIGVLTSPEADGWNDFRRHLEESGCGFDITLVPVKVQGADLKPTMLAGLRWFAERADDFDVLCIVRGGGSRTDLAWFDDREVAFAVARHPLKVVVGIGHQRDQSVLDLIAHSEKTPTAVAQLLVHGVEDARADVRERAERLLAAVAVRIADAGDALARCARDVLRAAVERLHGARVDLAGAGRRLLAG